MENELLGIGRGYLLAMLLVSGFIAMILVLAVADSPIGTVQKWAEVYTTFAAPILAVVVVPKEIAKIFKKKAG